jgi:hypothetical protein
MDADQEHVEDADAARTLLRDLDQVRNAVRERRNAYWFPLLVFGVLICASAPLYLRLPGRIANLKQRLDPESGTLTMLGGSPDTSLTSTSVVRAAFWLAILALRGPPNRTWSSSPISPDHEDRTQGACPGDRLAARAGATARPAHRRRRRRAVTRRAYE